MRPDILVSRLTHGADGIRCAGVARRLARTIPGGVILDQYGNPNNPLAHEFGTGPEIIHAISSTPSTPERPSSEKVDVLVAGAGTGGTVTGLSFFIKQKHNADCVIVGVDPVRSFPHFVSVCAILILVHAIRLEVFLLDHRKTR